MSFLPCSALLFSYVLAVAHLRHYLAVAFLCSSFCFFACPFSLVLKSHLLCVSLRFGSPTLRFLPFVSLLSYFLPLSFFSLLNSSLRLSSPLNSSHIHFHLSTPCFISSLLDSCQVVSSHLLPDYFPTDALLQLAGCLAERLAGWLSRTLAGLAGRSESNEWVACLGCIGWLAGLAGQAVLAGLGAGSAGWLARLGWLDWLGRLVAGLAGLAGSHMWPKNTIVSPTYHSGRSDSQIILKTIVS